jgi:ATP-dependent RNA helicase DDX23/PRP28
MRQRYLGIKTQQKRKILKATDKIQSTFDWDEADDTSQQGSLWTKRVPIKPAFGKGFIAGIDHSAQEREYMQHLSGDKKEAFEKLALQRIENEQTKVVDKNERHWSEKAVSEMSERDWRIFREDFNISSRGGSIPNPIRSWEESGLPEELLSAIRAAGYTKPSPIQMQAIPIALQGRDVLGVAETGSGKTASFVLPMLVYISKLPPLTAITEVDGPYAVIMAPTRELAQQIEEETNKFATFMRVRTVCLVGGQSIEEQGFQLRRGCEIIIATPGRLIDCLKSQYAVLNQCNYVVLDEADRMIDMGFEAQVNEVLDAMPSASLKSENEDEAANQETRSATGECLYRTTMMYSATMPPGVERLARKYLRRPASVAIGTVGRVVDRIEQRIRFARNEGDKFNILTDVLNKSPDPPIIIFANQKRAYG